MTPARLRMLAGPNGSGKTSLLRSLRDVHVVPLGFNLNPDEVDAAIRSSGRFSFAPWGVTTDGAGLQAFCRDHPMGRQIPADALVVVDDELVLASAEPTGYLAAVLSDFLRRRWVAEGRSFTYETVMSSGDEIELLVQARGQGFRTYTYFVCTEDRTINLRPVAYRVTQGGHDVPAGKVVARYARSLELLPKAVAASDRAFLFDNSEAAHAWVAEYGGGRLVAAARSLPNWFLTTMLNARPLP